MKVSILMACYKNDQPAFLREAIESTYEKQTRQPDELVLVVDGPIPAALEAVIAEFQQKHKEAFRVHRIAQNKGLGNALREGVLVCDGDYIIRMDADDVSHPARIEKLTDAAKANPTCDVIGSFTAEFERSPQQLISVRELKLRHDQIRHDAKKRSPVSHVSVILNRLAVLRAGNYQDFPLYEDYYLWMRMINKGSRFMNIPEVLVYVRTDKNRFKRKGNRQYKRSTIHFQNYLLRTGYIGGEEYIRNLTGRLIVGAMPSVIRKFIYLTFLRRKA